MLLNNLPPPPIRHQIQPPPNPPHNKQQQQEQKKQDTSPLLFPPNTKPALLISDAKTSSSTTTEPPPLRPPQPRRTNLAIWCYAILCLLFSLVLIFFGIATLIIFLAIKPRHPSFEIPAANLNSVYFDSPQYFNADFIFLVNFSNPNKKLDFKIEYMDIGLYFSDRLISMQDVQPFRLRRGEKTVDSVHFISSLVYLPQNLAVELQKQVQTNIVTYSVRANFKVRANLGLIHFTYWMHPRCQLVMSAPPTGVLLHGNCKGMK